MHLSDTDATAREVHEARLRGLSDAERLELMQGLTLSVQQLAFAGLRERHPNASDDEIWLRLAVNRLGESTVRRVYGQSPAEA